MLVIYFQKSLCFYTSNPQTINQRHVPLKAFQCYISEVQTINQRPRPLMVNQYTNQLSLLCRVDCKFLRKLMSLPYLPCEHIVPAFKLLKSQAEEMSFSVYALKWKIPMNWDYGTRTPILKDPNTDRQNPTNYRATAVTWSVYKAYCSNC